MVEAARPLDASDGLTDDTLLSVRQLKIAINTDEGRIVPVNGVDFSLKQGHTLGLVGESGSGKSLSTKALVHLLPNTASILDGSQLLFRTKAGSAVDLAQYAPRGKQIRHIRGGEIAMIFQEPMASFSPVYTIGNQIIEAIRLHRGLDKKEARNLAIDMLSKVGLSNPTLRIDQYPHELSGGMRQRAMIAIALSTNPSLLIADEPTTALDVTTQAQILNLIRSLQDELGMSVLFITHDMGVIAQVADDVAVMYMGEVVEYGPTRQVVRQPQHPYTRGLLAAIPSIDHVGGRLTPIGGDLPTTRPDGCPFHTRCAEAIPGRCAREAPQTVPVDPTWWARCHLLEQRETAS
ncbi:MAG: ABC transporter ATP-binding protein [Pseudomonadota bacterium]